MQCKFAKTPLCKRSYCGLGVSFVYEPSACSCSQAGATTRPPVGGSTAGRRRRPASIARGRISFAAPCSRHPLPQNLLRRCSQAVCFTNRGRWYKLASNECLVILVCSWFCEIHSKINISSNDLKLVLLDLACDALHLKNMNTHAIILCFYLYIYLC